MKITNENFKTFATMVAMPHSPDEYVPASMKRLMQQLDDYVVDVKGISFKHKARNRVRLITFSNEQEKQYYHETEKRLLEELALIEGRGYPNEQMLRLVLMLKFQQAAELIRAPWIARELYNIRNHKGRSAVCAFKYKETGAKIVRILTLDYGVSRERISMIWGGMASLGKKKAGKASKIEREIAKMKLSKEDEEFLRSLGIATNQELLDESIKQEESKQQAELTLLKLGTQSKTQRQAEIDKFQRDESDYCLFTFKSGGVGLSLHQWNEKMRPRETILAPTYSATEMVQGLGRCPRITSCSDTEQTIVFYANTIEVEVALKVSQKLKCLREVVRSKETWESIIIGHREISEGGNHIPEDGILAEVVDEMNISTESEEEEDDNDE